MDELRWQSYCKRFGPIMEPAFKNDTDSRMKLLEALDCIRNRQLNAAVEFLQEIREKACCDADTAAWSFFIGFCFELAGRKENMKHCYEASVSYGHGFYMPYLKLALMEHADANFEAAGAYYNEAIICLSQMAEEERDSRSLIKAWANLISCLTMMHRYSDAEELLRQAEGREGFEACGALLYAALGKGLKCRALLGKLEEEQRLELQVLTEQILNGSHPHFHPQTVEEGAVERFWLWFKDNEEELRGEMEETLPHVIGEELKKVFPFLEREAELRAERKGREIKLILKDRYAIGLQQGYGRLLTCAPQFKDWSFGIEH